MSKKKRCWVVEEKTSRLEDEITLRLSGEVNEDYDISVDHLVIGSIKTPVGDVRQLTTRIGGLDRYYNVLARLKPNRTMFRIEPGLYAIGTPDPSSDVLVTANYKLTLDVLRKELVDFNCWLLILNTHGVNVWCAAGKGSFSSAEIIYRLNRHRVKEIVNHKRIIVPQLGGPGVSYFDVLKHTKMKIVYGPARAKDIKDFVSNQHQTTETQRQVSFNLIDRLTLIPLEVVNSIHMVPLFVIFNLILNVLSSKLSYELLVLSIYNSIPYLITYLLGVILFPLIIEFLPFRAFSMKGALLGLVASILVLRYPEGFMLNVNYFTLVGHAILICSLSSYLTLNFTGSTTFTSFSGVKKETIIFLKGIKVFTPIAILLFILAIIFWGVE